ncbi:MAG TPA: TetR/AcrR family transcriptional regulator [Jatrophihabitans sp.]|nr:TetR/AcrR family transcriptional regulator [Jatrophihabitans sp.]
MVDGRIERGSRTRTAVLDAAVATASVDGLDGMSLAQLAGLLGVSKSGLFAHWPDKERLQLDVVEHAVEQWQQRIIAPALRRSSAVERLWTLHLRRLNFYAERVLPGRCFFAAVRPEFDDRPGPVRDAILAATSAWTRFLADQVRRGVRVGELRGGVDPAQLAFEIDALGEAAATHPRPAARRHSRRAVLDRLRALATDPSVLPKE